MTMAGKWQQPRKQRPHQRRKQRLPGDGDTGSGGKGKIGIALLLTTATE